MLARAHSGLRLFGMKVWRRLDDDRIELRARKLPMTITALVRARRI